MDSSVELMKSELEKNNIDLDIRVIPGHRHVFYGLGLEEMFREVLE